MPIMSQPAAADVEFMAIAESGILEAQALLLCESIRRFAGVYAKSAITIVSPRAARRPSPATQRKFERLDAEFVATELVSPFPEYGPSFRVAAAAHLARRPGAPVLVQLDSDTLFLAAPDFALTQSDFAARPVDIKGICTTGVGDPGDSYWRKVSTLCGVDYDAIGWVTTTVDKLRVRANYNAGLIAARRASGVFERTEEIFKCMVEQKLISHARPPEALKIGAGAISPDGFTYWGTSQIALSLACTALRARVEILPAEYNMPLHFFDSLEPNATPPVHVHYHWLGNADELATSPLVDGRMALPAAQARWLRSRLPLDKAPDRGLLSSLRQALRR
jgi:hypothetical protein